MKNILILVEPDRYTQTFTSVANQPTAFRFVIIAVVLGTVSIQVNFIALTFRVHLLIHM